VQRVASLRVNVWYEYRLAWSAHPWVIGIVLIGLALVVAAIVGMFVGGPLVVLFIPGLAAIYIHHLIVQKISDGPA
jgi:hypothetical protein